VKTFIFERVHEEYLCTIIKQVAIQTRSWIEGEISQRNFYKSRQFRPLDANISRILIGAFS
jgi:hypothetical protein